MPAKLLNIYSGDWEENTGKSLHSSFDGNYHQVRFSWLYLINGFIDNSPMAVEGAPYYDLEGAGLSHVTNLKKKLNKTKIMDLSFVLLGHDIDISNIIFCSPL